MANELWSPAGTVRFMSARRTHIEMYMHIRAFLCSLPNLSNFRH